MFKICFPTWINDAYCETQRSTPLLNYRLSTFKHPSARLICVMYPLHLKEVVDLDLSISRVRGKAWTQALRDSWGTCSRTPYIMWNIFWLDAQRLFFQCNVTYTCCPYICYWRCHLVLIVARKFVQQRSLGSGPAPLTRPLWGGKEEWRE